MRVNVDRSLQLPTSEYYAEHEAKSGIALHYTVSDDAHSAVRRWHADMTATGKPSHVATAYVIDWNGTVYQLFDPAAWAFSLGLPWPYRQRVAFEKRFIGIEITSTGGLTEHDGRLYSYGVTASEFEKPRAKAFECATPYRDYRWFDIDHANAASWRAQKDRLLALDSLRSVVASLQDSVTRLQAANAPAYATGYDPAYASHQDLTRRYIAELNKPRIRLPSIVGFLGTVGVGIVVGRVTR